MQTHNKIPTPEVCDSDFGAFEAAAATLDAAWPLPVDKARALAHYTAMAAQAALLPYLNDVDPVAARWERQTSRPADLLVKHRGARWDVRMVCDSYDGETGPKASDWWLYQVRVDGVWFDAPDVLRPELIRELEAAARRLPE